MSLPTLNKTWVFNINNVQLAQGTIALDGKMLLFNIKQALVAAGWTVVRSSDGSVVSNADNWGLNIGTGWSGGGAHSWIVLQNTALTTNFQICLDCDNGTATGMYVTFCQGGYNLSTGTTSARPSSTIASDEVILINNGSWGLSAVTANYAWHLMTSSDLQCTRLVILSAGVVTGCWIIDKPQNPVASWTNPHFMIALGTQNVTNALSITNTLNGASAVARMLSSLATTNVSHFLGQEGFNVGSSNGYASGILTTPSDQDAASLMMPISLWSQTVNGRGRNGQVFDLWYGLSVYSTGTSYPSSGTLYQFVQFGVLIFPWQSGTPPVTA